MFRRSFPAGVPLKFEDVVNGRRQGLSRPSSTPRLRELAHRRGCHHTDTYRHCLFVTGFAVAFRQQTLGMRDGDQRRLTRAALLHDVGKALHPRRHPGQAGGKLTDEEMAVDA